MKSDLEEKIYMLTVLIKQEREILKRKETQASVFKEAIEQSFKKIKSFQSEIQKLEEELENR